MPDAAWDLIGEARSPFGGPGLFVWRTVISGGVDLRYNWHDTIDIGEESAPRRSAGNGTAVLADFAPRPRLAGLFAFSASP